MKSNSALITVFVISNLVTVITAAFLLSIMMTNKSDSYQIEKLVSDFDNPIYKICLIASAVLSMTGIIVGISLASKMEQFNNLDAATYEMKEQKEKYEQATESFAQLQKVKTI
jgi:cytochrome bd-type quinol oxidase subunit 1